MRHGAASADTDKLSALHLGWSHWREGGREGEREREEQKERECVLLVHNCV